VIASPDLKGSPDLNGWLLEFLDVMSQKGYNPVVARTKIDLVDKKLTAEPQNVYSSKKVTRVIHNASKLTGLNRNEIVPMKNYLSEFDRNPLLENSHLYCLSIACKGALGNNSLEGKLEISESQE
jgi:hypothetical protein